MSEYWKSTPKYWCKHCSIYVKDTPFERKQHENTGKHQGNLKRFLRGVQNDHERNERDKAKAKAEVERLKGIVGDSSTAVVASLAKSQASTPKSKQPAPSAADQKRQWTQLAEMGIQVPDTYRSEVAMAGDWEVTSRRNIADENEISESLSTGVRKRKHDTEEEEESLQGIEGNTSSLQRRWGTTTRQYPGQQDAGLDALFSTTVRKGKAANIVESPNKDSIDTNAFGGAGTNGSEQINTSSGKSPTTDVLLIQTEESAWQSIEPTPVKTEQGDEDKPKIFTIDESEVATPIFRKRKAKFQLHQ